MACYWSFRVEEIEREGERERMYFVIVGVTSNYMDVKDSLFNGSQLLHRYGR